MLHELYQDAPQRLQNVASAHMRKVAKPAPPCKLIFAGAVAPSLDIDRLQTASYVIAYLAKILGKSPTKIGITIGTHTIHGSQTRRMELPMCEFGCCGYTQSVIVQLDRLRGGAPTYNTICPNYYATEIQRAYRQYRINQTPPAPPNTPVPSEAATELYSDDEDEVQVVAAPPTPPPMIIDLTAAIIDLTIDNIATPTLYGDGFEFSSKAMVDYLAPVANCTRLGKRKRD